MHFSLDRVHFLLFKYLFLKQKMFYAKKCHLDFHPPSQNSTIIPLIFECVHQLRFKLWQKLIFQLHPSEKIQNISPWKNYPKDIRFFSQIEQR